MSPRACNSLDAALLVLGLDLRLDFVDAQLLGDRAAVRALSPVSITIRSPSSCSARTASGVDSLIGSATAEQPGRPAVDGDEHDRLPALRPAASASLARASIRSTPSSSSSVALADQRRAVALDDGPHAAAGDRVELARLGQPAPDSWPPRRRPAASGCSLLCSTRRGKAQQVVLANGPAAVTMSVDSRAAFGERAGLVDDEASTFSSVSSTSAFLISTPASRRGRRRP